MDDKSIINSNNQDFELSNQEFELFKPSINRFINALGSANPDIGKDDLNNLGTAAIDKLSDCMENGELIGSVIPFPDGRAEFRTLFTGKKVNRGDTDERK